MILNAFEAVKRLRKVNVNVKMEMNRLKAWREESGEWRAMNGTLVSPNFPRPYPARLQCRVDFKAPQRHRIRLVPSHTSSLPPLNLSNRRTVVAVKISEGRQHKLATFCGPGIPHPIMSSGSYLSLVFRSYTSGPHVTGYRAVYTFLKTNERPLQTSKDENCKNTDLLGNQFTTTAEMFQFQEQLSLMPLSIFVTFLQTLQCFELSSALLCPTGIYPRNTVCQYIFRGLDNQKVKLTFKYFDIEGVAPCTAESDSDYVEFSSTIEQDLLPRRCGRFAPKVSFNILCVHIT
nr:LOW QUALITY PROTEIN: cubilin-like [Cherax quadricarinatus]